MSSLRVKISTSSYSIPKFASNTGGQASKAAPTAAVAQFAAAGKKTRKKDLGMMQAQYGYIYVAQVAMGADKNQFMKALKEAEEYDGPSLIIGCAPCINHGLKIGRGQAGFSSKKTCCRCRLLASYSQSGIEEQGKNPFILDSKPPKVNFREFLMGETRFSSLQRTFPEIAGFEKTKKTPRIVMKAMYA